MGKGCWLTKKSEKPWLVLSGERFCLGSREPQVRFLVKSECFACGFDPLLRARWASCGRQLVEVSLIAYLTLSPLPLSLKIDGKNILTLWARID